MPAAIEAEYCLGCESDRWEEANSSRNGFLNDQDFSICYYTAGYHLAGTIADRESCVS